MSHRMLSAEALARALSIRDLTDPSKGPHAMQVLLKEVVSAIRSRWRCRVEEVRGSPIVSVHDNYDALGYPPDGAAREARYSRYVTKDSLLRTQTSAMIPGALRASRGRDPQLLVVRGLQITDAHAATSARREPAEPMIASLECELTGTPGGARHTLTFPVITGVVE